VWAYAAWSAPWGWLSKLIMRSKEPILKSQPTTEENPKSAGGQGKKAKFAELNSTYSYSYFQFPDGSVPNSSSTSKKNGAGASGLSKEEEEDRAAAVPQLISKRKKRKETGERRIVEESHCP
jgi:hypothetical protein